MTLKAMVKVKMNKIQKQKKMKMVRQIVKHNRQANMKMARLILGIGIVMTKNRNIIIDHIDIIYSDYTVISVGVKIVQIYSCQLMHFLL